VAEAGRSGNPATVLDVNVTGIKRLTLSTTDGANGKNSDQADWGVAQLSCSP
jgi:hypothetical protein